MTIHFDDNSNLKLIEVEEKYDRVEKEARLVDLIISHGYQTIELKTQEGKIIYCKNLRKIKYDKV
jgi:ADP-dependent phosphofructokinase/glucokinase